MQIDTLIIPVDFMLDIERQLNHENELLILLRRPFMAMTKIIINVKNGKLTMTVLDETVKFSILNSLTLPADSSDCFLVDVLDSVIFSNFM